MENLTARSFLIFLAVRAYNEQYKTTFDPVKFDILSIPNNSNSTVAYEVYTVRFDDNLRLRLYCSNNNVSVVGKYRMFDEQDNGLGVADTVFIADAMLGNEFIWLSNNAIRQSFPVLEENVESFNIIMLDGDQGPLLLEDGGFLILEQDN